MAARFARSVSAGSRNVSVVHLCKTAALELGQYGINVNVIYPAITYTETIKDRIYSDEKKRQQGAQNHMGRSVTAEEIAYVAAFLCSPLSVSITGDIVAATGGRGATVYY